VSALALLLAAAIGLSLGTLGGGGSVLTVPVLVYLVGYDPKVAVPTSLAVVGAASLMGAVVNWRAGRVDLRVALPFGIVTVAGSYFGAKIGARMPGEAQLLILAVVMVTAAVLMLRPSNRRQSAPATENGAQDQSPVATETRAAAIQQIGRLSPVAAGVGLLTGIVGVGGGFLIVPALVIWGHVAMRTAVGTSLFVITLNCVSGLAGYAGSVTIPWAGTALFAAVAVAGSAAGTAIAGAIPQQRLRQIFAVFLLCVGGFVMYRNRGVFTGRHELLRTQPSNHRAGDTAGGPRAAGPDTAHR
jgi:uncharacterized membrane protein YfcA